MKETVMRRLVLTAVILLAVPAVRAQAPLTDDALQPLVKAAVAAGGTNADKAMDALDKAVKTQFGDVPKNADMLGRIYGTTLAAIIQAPYATFRLEIRKRLQKLEPVDDVHYNPDVVTVM